MEPEEPTGITRSGRLVRLFVGGLPLGLIVMGALSFVVWNYKKREKPPVVLEFAAMLQRDVNATDYERYVRLLTEDIGGSSMTAEEKSDAVAGFVESSMGLDNMGYETRRKTTDDGGSVVYSELPAKGRARSVLLVVTDGSGAEFDKGKAGCVAALMSVAHAMTGKPQDQLVRFAVVFGDQSKAKEATRTVTTLTEETRYHLNLDLGGESTAELVKGVGTVIKVVSAPAETGDGWVFNPDGGDVVPKLKELQGMVEAAATGR